jgi:transposase-like protein
MMENGKQRQRRQHSPEEKWEIFLEVTSQADAARKWNVDVSTVVRLRALARDAALAAFASAKPGRPASPEQVELESALPENERLSEALEMAVELTLHRGRQRSGFPGPVPARVSAETKLELIGLIDGALADGWAHARACRVLGIEGASLAGQVARDQP